MNQQQYDRWRDFALRMARTCWTNRNRPKRDWIVEAVEDFLDSVEDWELIESWEHSADYPEGHDYRRATYDGPCWCVLNPPKKKSKKVCSGCQGTGHRVDWASRSLLCDDMSCWADDYTRTESLSTVRFVLHPWVRSAIRGLASFSAPICWPRRV